MEKDKDIMYMRIAVTAALRRRYDGQEKDRDDPEKDWKFPVGCVIRRSRKEGETGITPPSILSIGWNGDVKGLESVAEKEKVNKIRSWFCFHAEENAVHFSRHSPEGLIDATVYVTQPPCATCARILVVNTVLVITWTRMNGRNIAT